MTIARSLCTLVSVAFLIGSPTKAAESETTQLTLRMVDYGLAGRSGQVIKPERRKNLRVQSQYSPKMILPRVKEFVEPANTQYGKIVEALDYVIQRAASCHYSIESMKLSTFEYKGQRFVAKKGRDEKGKVSWFQVKTVVDGKEFYARFSQDEGMTEFGFHKGERRFVHVRLKQYDEKRQVYEDPVGVIPHLVSLDDNCKK